MSGRGAVLPALQHVLDRHTTDVSATEVHDLWCTRIVSNEDLLGLLPRLVVDAVRLATNQDPRRAAVGRAGVRRRTDLGDFARAGLLVG
jgi:hypothetical protein